MSFAILYAGTSEREAGLRVREAVAANPLHASIPCSVIFSKKTFPPPGAIFLKKTAGSQECEDSRSFCLSDRAAISSD